MRERNYHKSFILLFCIYFFVSMVFPNEFKLMGRVGISEAFFAVMVLCYFILLILRKDGFKRFFKSILSFLTNKLYLSLTILLIIMIYSVSYSLEKTLAAGETIRFFTYLISGFIVVNEFKELREKELLLNTFIAGSLIVSIMGLAQIFTGKGMTVGIIINDVNVPRMESTLGNPNSLGAFAVIAFFPILMLGLHEKSSRKKTLYFILNIFLAMNIALTFSRNSWIALFIGMIVLTLLYNWKLIFVLIAGGSLSLLIPQVLDRIKQLGDMSINASRLYIWATAAKMIKDYPLRGVGNGNFISYYDIYTERYPELKMEGFTRFPTHNHYLKIQSELGIFGSIAFALSLLFSFISIYSASKLQASRYSYFYKGFLVSFICFLLLNLFDNILSIPQLTLGFWILIFNAQNIPYKDFN
ncbi:O-antigen ligase family protein [Clostridium polynesiense]|uniref:O-antigen ligase family protein n=1 Tax=Clostridium polynesiense TaxID=1325933 RepID=UPI0006940FD5|nr:O-antigen ligase family protein [Clostridium polynesiense]